MPHNKIQVVARVRPTLKDDQVVCVETIDDKTLDIVNIRNKKECLRYEFSKVFNDTSSQHDVFNHCVRPMLGYVTTGQNGAVFAYGPTGAGKTHTIFGTPEDPGIIPRTVIELFKLVQKKELQDWKFTVHFSYLEIYNEKVIDLLCKTSDTCQDLPIREDKKKNVFVTGLTSKEIKSFDDFKQSFGEASQKRTVASTKLNQHSSRSHCLLLISVVKQQQCEPYRKLSGKLYLIDLAGSENNRKTGNKGIRLKESGAINTSLFVLDRVVDALNNGLPHVPYRDSKLTRLLQDCIGGNAHSLMIANVAPEFDQYMETYSCMNFAQKTKTLINKTMINETTERPAPKVGKKRSTETGRPNKENLEGKKRKISTEQIEVETATPEVPLLAPLLQKQTNMEDVIRGLSERLGALEENLIENTTKDSGNAAATLKTIKEEVKKLQDKTLEEKSKPVPCHKNLKELVTKTDEISASPLFKNHVMFSKRGFRSTAASCRSLADVFYTPKQKKKTKNFNPEVQEKFSVEILDKLNNGNEHDLQELQTIGKKRALLIVKWREINGALETVDDLSRIPGITDKYVENFKKNNLLVP